MLWYCIASFPKWLHNTNSLSNPVLVSLRVHPLGIFNKGAPRLGMPAMNRCNRPWITWPMGSPAGEQELSSVAMHMTQTLHIRLFNMMRAVCLFSMNSSMYSLSDIICMIIRQQFWGYTQPTAASLEVVPLHFPTRTKIVYSEHSPWVLDKKTGG